jgi:D-alanyl-D-alanine carboxypeptidase
MIAPGRAASTLNLVALALLWAPPAPADDYVPRRCAAAVDYVGAPLHDPLPDSLFEHAGGDLGGTLGDSLRAGLEGVVSWVLAHTAAPAMTAAVGIPGEGLWSVSRGLARTEPPTPLATEPLFYWASAGKAFTAAVVMQLVTEGRISYNDSLARWFPRFPNAGAITVDHLLTHTSGAFSFNQDLRFRKQGGYRPPADLVRIAERHGNAFCPGERWSYSNTGYVLLALIIEQVEGRPFHEVVTRRVIERLGLRHTRALAPRERPPALAFGHLARKPDPDFEPSMPFGAGMIAASAGDLVVFWQALLSGRLTGPDTIRRAYQHLYPMFDPGTFYGRGVMLIEFQPAGGLPERWLGHGGGTPSSKAVVAYDARSRVFVAVAINGDVSAEAAAFRLLGEVRARHAAAGD